MEAAVHPDWSGLPEDLMALVMRVLDIPDMLRAGAVCTSWHAACSAVRSVRIPIKDASPCLLYSCAGDDADTATLYSPSAGAAFKVHLPGPAFRSLYVMGSGHGWIVAADDASNLRALNPLTGAQVELPPVTGLHNVESSDDDQGRPVYTHFDEMESDTPCMYTRRELRLFLYHRVYLSCSPSAGGECIVLLLHKVNGEMSFARVGDKHWTLVTRNAAPWNCGYRAAAYSKKDGLFYVLSSDSSLYTLDLNNGGPSPVARKVIEVAARLWEDPASYIVLAPWGDMLHVRRYTELRTRSTPAQVPAEHAHEVIDPSLECCTDEIQLYKVDTHNQKLVEISSSDLQGHALFLGFNSPMLISTEDFPRFKPNCAYLTDDAWEQICINMFGCREVGIWDFETETLGSLGDDLHSAHPWLNWPPPIWITPSLV